MHGRIDDIIDVFLQTVLTLIFESKQSMTPHIILIVFCNHCIQLTFPVENVLDSDSFNRHILFISWFIVILS